MNIDFCIVYITCYKRDFSFKKYIVHLNIQANLHSVDINIFLKNKYTINNISVYMYMYLQFNASDFLHCYIKEIGSTITITSKSACTLCECAMGEAFGCIIIGLYVCLRM